MALKEAAAVTIPTTEQRLDYLEKRVTILADGLAHILEEWSALDADLAKRLEKPEALASPAPQPTVASARRHRSQAS